MQTATSYFLTGFMMLVVGLTLGTDMIVAFENLRQAWNTMADRTEQIAITRLGASVDIETNELTEFTFTVVNQGHTALGKFEEWDAIFDREGLSSLEFVRLDYTTDADPSAGEWTVTGIYMDADTLTAEVVDPGLLNPGEEMIVKAAFSTSGGTNKYHRATLVTPNGIPLQISYRVRARIYVADATDRIVYEYASDGTYLSQSTLDASNDSPRGVTTKDSNFWLTDIGDDEVYKYDLSFALDGSWAQALLNTSGQGIATDGTNIWVVNDGLTAEIYKYDMDGTPDVGLPSFDLTLGNDDPAGIATDGSNLWVVDRADAEVYKYDTDGSYDTKFALDSENADATGITTDGASLWVVDVADDKAYQYDIEGTLVSSFDLLAANDDAQGITTRIR